MAQILIIIAMVIIGLLFFVPIVITVCGGIAAIVLTPLIASDPPGTEGYDATYLAVFLISGGVSVPCVFGLIGWFFGIYLPGRLAKRSR